MNETPATCPRCGTPLTAGEAGGGCPRCLTNALFTVNSPMLATSSEAQIIRRLGDYELLEEIARGGMGIVYRARQVSLNRIVAVKLMRDSALAGAEQVKRFKVEAGAAAKLKHPHIVAIHEVGEENGQHYFAMNLVEGTNLAERTREGPLPPRQAAELVATIAEAVQHAHEKGVLHRDLKPANVLLDGEGRPFVTDFGLARSLEADSSLTLTGQVLGTPGYMPPEQATGAGTVGPAADIYSLGAVLYCLLTGRAPFVGGTPAETMRHVVEQEPVSPQLVNPEVPRDLTSVCLKCLAKRPGDRYASASELAADLRRFVRGEPTHARPAGQTERLWRWCQRKPAIAGLAGVTMLLVLIVAIGSPIVAYRMNESRKFAEGKELIVRQTLYAADMRLVQQSLTDGDLGTARRLLAAHQPTNNAADLRGWEWWYSATQCRGDEAHIMRTTNVHVWTLLSCPRLNGVLVAWQDGTLELWDPTLRRASTKLAKEQSKIAVMESDPSGRLLASCGERAPIKLWSIGDSSKLELLRTFAATGHVAIAPKESIIATTALSPPASDFAGTDLGLTAVWNYTTGEKLQTLPESGHKPTFSRDGRILVTGSWKGSLKVWNTADWSLRHTLARAGQISELAFAPDGDLLVTGNTGGEVAFWNPSEGQLLKSEIGHVGGTTFVCFSPDGKMVASTGHDQTIALWDAASRQELSRFKGHGASPLMLAFSPDGRWLWSTRCQDNTMRFWRVEAPSRTNTPLQIYSRPVFSPDSRLIAFGNQRMRVSIWDVATRQLKATLPAEPNPVGFSSDGKLLITATVETPLPLHPNVISSLKFWDVASGKLSKEVILSSTNEFISAVALSPDGGTLATGGRKGNVTLWDAATGERRHQVPTIPERVWSLSFSDDGAVLAIGAGSGLGRNKSDLPLWNLRTQRLSLLPKAGAELVAMSPDGQIVASQWVDHVRLWSTRTGELLDTIRARGFVKWTAFSKDGRTLATAAKDLQLWNLATSREVASFMRDAGPAVVGFSPDGRSLLGARIGEGYLWTADWDAEPGR